MIYYNYPPTKLTKYSITVVVVVFLISVILNHIDIPYHSLPYLTDPLAKYFGTIKLHTSVI